MVLRADATNIILCYHYIVVYLSFIYYFDVINKISLRRLVEVSFSKMSFAIRGSFETFVPRDEYHTMQTKKTLHPN